MIVNVHAGHNPDGKIACGAIGIIRESTEARKVKDLVIKMLSQAGNTVYDCTVEDGNSQNDVLNKIVRKCNANNVDLDISIHFNSGRNDYKGDGANGGTEVWVYPNSAIASAYALKICEQISALGYRNRGVKSTKDLYYLRKTKAQALLIECCFVDDADDTRICNAETMACAIVTALIGSVPTSSNASVETSTSSTQNATKSNEEIAKEVVAGKWGNGNERKQRLTDAGYDYATIQAIINGKATTSQTVSYYPRYTGNTQSIVVALKAVGVDSSLSNRKKIASANGISGYSGTAAQNIQMLNLLKQGKLKK